MGADQHFVSNIIAGIQLPAATIGNPKKVQNLLLCRMMESRLISSLAFPDFRTGLLLLKRSRLLSLSP
jgi:hypothetical protein